MIAGRAGRGNSLCLRGRGRLLLCPAAIEALKENQLMLRTSVKHGAMGKSLAAAGLLAAALATGAGLAGCAPSYRDQRPPMDQLDPRDRGLQSKDVLQASDDLAMDLLALPELNDSRTQWTVVVDQVQD